MIKRRKKEDGRKKTDSTIIEPEPSMRQLTSETGFRRNYPDCRYVSTWLIATICALVVPGCEEETRSVAKRPETRALDQTGVAVGLDETGGRAPVQTKPQVKQSGPIIGQRTTDIRNASKELNQGGAQVASPRIVSKDPITLPGNAYVSIVSRSSALSIQHSMDLYHATNERYPKDLDEFMAEIIKPNGIALPQLPPYQKYAYDEKAHKLIILEYEYLKN
jgi:hypothetical protein